MAYAVRIVEENLQAIRSEHPKYDEEYARKFMENFPISWFIRDEGGAFDCRYYPDAVFMQLYQFKDKDEGTLFRLIELRPRRHNG